MTRLAGCALVALAAAAVSGAVGAVAWFALIGATGERPPVFFVGFYVGMMFAGLLSDVRREWREQTFGREVFGRHEAGL